MHRRRWVNKGVAKRPSRAGTEDLSYDESVCSALASRGTSQPPESDPQWLMLQSAWSSGAQPIQLDFNSEQDADVPEPDFPTDTDDAKKLSDADQARVDAFLERGVNSVERKPFKPLFLIFLLMAVVAAFSLLSQGIAQWAGIY